MEKSSRGVVKEKIDDESVIFLIFFLVFITEVVIGAIINNHCSNRVRFPMSLAEGKLIP